MTDIAPVHDEIVAFADFLNTLIDVIEVGDGCQWLAGDELQGIETRYKDHTIEQIADEVGKAPATLYDWKAMSAFYDPATRQHYKEKGLYYSHLKVGMRHFDTLESACEFLDECSAQNWSVRGAQIEVKAFKGEAVAKPSPLVATLIFRQENGRIIVEGAEHLPMGVRLDAKLTEGV